MKLDLSPQQVSRLGQVNGKYAHAQIMYLYDHPEVIAGLPDGAHLFTVTGDVWVDEQNRLMAEQLKAEGETVAFIELPAETTAVLEHAAI